MLSGEKHFFEFNCLDKWVLSFNGKYKEILDTKQEFFSLFTEN